MPAGNCALGASLTHVVWSFVVSTQTLALVDHEPFAVPQVVKSGYVLVNRVAMHSVRVVIAAPSTGKHVPWFGRSHPPAAFCLAPSFRYCTAAHAPELHSIAS